MRGFGPARLTEGVAFKLVLNRYTIKWAITYLDWSINTHKKEADNKQRKKTNEHLKEWRNDINTWSSVIFIHLNWGLNWNI